MRSSPPMSTMMTSNYCGIQMCLCSKNVLEAVDAACPKLERACFQTGKVCIQLPWTPTPHLTSQGYISFRTMACTWDQPEYLLKRHFLYIMIRGTTSTIPGGPPEGGSEKTQCLVLQHHPSECHHWFHAPWSVLFFAFFSTAMEFQLTAVYLCVFYSKWHV